MREIIGLSGNPQRPSKTRVLVRESAAAIAVATGGRSTVFDLVDLAPSLATAASLDDLNPAAREIADRLLSADILVVGSPVYKASYAGMFKHFFDLLPHDALVGKIVCLTATGGSDRHALVIEQHMRPLFTFFAAFTLPTAIFATPADFDGDAIRSANIRARLGMISSEAATLVGASAMADIGRTEPRHLRPVPLKAANTGA